MIGRSSLNLLHLVCHVVFYRVVVIRSTAAHQGHSTVAVDVCDAVISAPLLLTWRTTAAPKTQEIVAQSTVRSRLLMLGELGR